MNLGQRIIKQKLEKYLNEIILKYQKGKSEAVFVDFNHTLNNPSSEDILKYFYFYKYYLGDKYESEKSLSYLEEILFSKGFENKEICFFYFNYGTLCPSLLQKINRLYHDQEHNSRNFIIITRILMYNDINNWEERCLNKFDCFKDSPFEFRISQLINHKYGKQMLKTQQRKQYHKPSISTSQLNETNLIIKNLGLDCQNEVQFHDFNIDTYIPSLETIVEMDGPDHFFPLQSQFKSLYKFRYHYLNTFFKKRLVSIPYFEFTRQDNDYLLSQLLYKLIYSEYDLFDSKLFQTNFDLLGQIWNFKKIKVDSKANLLNKL